MSVRIKIFGAFLLIIAMGVSLVVVRAVSVNSMIKDINTQHNLQKEAASYRDEFMAKIAANVPAEFKKDIEDFSQKSKNYDNSLYTLGENVIEAGNSGSRLGIIVAVPTILVCFLTAYIISTWISKKIYWYDDMLDHLPIPLSVTDNNMKCTFINRPVEEMLGVKRSDVLGKYCGDIWKAGICNTQDCGIDCLRRGKLSTVFEQGGFIFKVDSAYLKDAHNKNVGHVEAVQNITELMKTQNEQSQLINNIKAISDTFISVSTELSSETETNAVTAGEASSLAGTIKSNAEKSSKQMQKMMQAVEEITEANRAIVNVTKAINDIARRTNILALNASVEAVRGGEQGRSFAVVAEEIRNLATQSAVQVQDTERLIQNSIEKAALGAELANVTAGTLDEIVASINSSAELINEIAKSSETQKSSINHLHSGVEKIAVILDT